MVTLKDTLFEFGKADLKSGTQRDLKKMANILQEYPERKILVEGHTDSIGNQSLSERRAVAVKEQLILAGVDAARIEARGHGKEYPIVSNASEAGRQQNRRVEITILNDDASTSSGFDASQRQLKRDATPPPAAE
jgi:outer membrane protein OmpA-like peptidoglycan-associated protein